MRLFFAIWPPRETAQALHAWAIEAQRLCGGRVMRAETMHLTLAFLGDVEEERLPDLTGLAVKADRHLLPIEQARYWRHNRIVWAGPLETPDATMRLVAGLNENLSEKNFDVEKRAFAAHVTLLREAGKSAELPPVPAVAWPVEEFLLVCSQLGPKGPHYETVARFTLG